MDQGKDSADEEWHLERWSGSTVIDQSEGTAVGVREGGAIHN